MSIFKEPSAHGVVRVVVGPIKHFTQDKLQYSGAPFSSVRVTLYDASGEWEVLDIFGPLHGLTVEAPHVEQTIKVEATP